MQEVKSLWHRAFGDTKQYMDYYFAQKAPASRLYTDYEGVELASMMFFTPYEICFRGKLMTAEYIVGVATEEKYRRQGRMAHLMKQAIEMEHERGIDWVFLCPENPAVYDSLGFIPTYWRETTYYEADEEWDVREFQVMNWGRLEQKEKENVCFFVEAMLRNEEFDIYMHHSLPYMEAVNKELKALEGETYVVKRKGSIVATVNVIREENQHQITELVCSRQFGKEVLEAIVRRLDTPYVVVDDSYFLDELEGKGVNRVLQKKPYIMARYTSHQTFEPLLCYINDIT